MCRDSSVVEQRFCKPLVASSNLAPGSRLVGGLDEGVDVLLKKFLGRWRSGQSHLTVNQATSVYGGSNPSLPTGFCWSVSAFRNLRRAAVVAQLVEHLHGKEKVTGPIPVNGSEG